MKKLTFGKQIIIGILFLFFMFICSTLFKNGIFSVIGWVAYGLMFVINPVCPEKAESVKNIHIWITFAGIAVMIAGITTHFGQ